MAISNNSTGLRPGVCTSTTRPTAPYEGQMIYTTDLDTLELWNGTAWRIMGAATATSGSILQVVGGVTTTQVTSSSTTPVDTTLTATITPKSTSSKILVIVHQEGLLKLDGNTDITLNLFRNSTLLLTIGTQIGVTGTTTLNGVGGAGTSYVDSPATTSAVTYKTQFFSRANIATAAVQHAGATSTITLKEIAG